MATSEQKSPLKRARTSDVSPLSAWRHVYNQENTKEGFTIIPMPCNADNYAYLVLDHQSEQAAVVDAGEKDATPLLQAIQKHGVSLSQVTHVLSTHKHWDHSDGNAGFLAAIKDLTIVGPQLDKVPSATKEVNDGDEIKVGSLTFKCIHTPCHTRGSMCFLLTGKSTSKTAQQILFTGDTLFTAGCGRFFEGTGKEMHDALIKRIGALPDETVVYGGHEYTVSNLSFGAHVEPNNDDISAKLKWAQRKRNANECTQPSTIGEEKRINVFMRVNHPDVQKFASLKDAVEVMDALRTKKNSFKAPDPGATTKL